MGTQKKTGVHLSSDAGTEKADPQVLEDYYDYSADALGGEEKGEVSVTTGDSLQSTDNRQLVMVNRLRTK